MHLSSAIHDADEFKCPGCGKKVKAISALVQHIESGVCHDSVKVKEMTDYSKGNSLTLGENLQDSVVTESKTSKDTSVADARAGEAYSTADYASPARAYSVDDKSSGQSECCFGAAATLTCDYTPPEEKIVQRGIWRYLFCM
ncbi:hypothetical protein BDQ12DRAFT_373118 [Crucibulum laeve]|uniref:C2H2-type domain-containing protein n=1 Tax=Crucibulum laeve TaxID=68775 RepID=A0A5C3LGI3_9AGAR|nr:hypothetical protein BDQ12DRAFT_373118 [Crucibulum laeve]